MLDKALKILWFVNGVLLLALLSFLGYHLVREELESNDSDKTDAAVVLGGEPAERLNKGEQLQGLVYDRIENVPGTSIRILPISAKRFEVSSDKRNKHAVSYLRGAKELHEISHDNANLVFMDIDYRVINTLLSRKAFIHVAASPALGNLGNIQDPLIKNIIYLISFEDTNNDGLMSGSDSSDLYISDIRGSNLVQVTRNVFVKSYQFINNNTQILISFQKRGGSGSEYQPIYFAKYQIGRQTLIEMSELQQELLKVEKLLQVEPTEKKP